MMKMQSCRVPQFTGELTVPGDKSLSHRAVMFAAMAVGESRISGLLEGEDVLATIKTLEHLGVDIYKKGDTWHVHGVGVGNFVTPDTVLDMGNSGTSARLFSGILASNPIKTTMTGDKSLSKRPMGRVIDPLTQMGAVFDARDGKLPMTIHGTDDLIPIVYESPKASAQIKSAILLAGLNTYGKTTVIEPTTTRDYTESMLSNMGAKVTRHVDDSGRHHVSITGYPTLKPLDHFTVPGDPSSAAFFTVAALIIPGAEVTLKNVGTNPLRMGLYETLQEMGGDITFLNKREVSGEHVADIHVRHSDLKGISVPEARIPSMIDECPVLAVAAAFAHGTTTLTGVHELRVKESDRLSATAEGLKANGVSIQETEDSLTIYGEGKVTGGGLVKTHLDHRMAMSFLVMGLASQNPVTIDDGTAINTSFPTFQSLMDKAGGDIQTL